MNPKLEAFARMLYRDDDASLADLQTALDNWLPFYRKHGRGIGVDVDWLEELWEDGADPWDVVIDVAHLHGWLFEADWREVYSELVQGIRTLNPCKGIPIDWDSLSGIDSETPMNSFLQGIAAAFSRHGEALVVLDKASDSLPLTLIPEARLDDAKSLLGSLSLGEMVVVREHPSFGVQEQPRVSWVDEDAIAALAHAAAQAMPLNCIQCLGAGTCYCIRKGPGIASGCPRCRGSGKCNVCGGTGKGKLPT